MVLPEQTGFGDDPGIVRLVLDQLDEQRLGDVLGKRHGIEGADLVDHEIPFDAGNRVRLGRVFEVVQERRHPGQHGVRVGGVTELLPVDGDHLRRNVVDEDLAVPVEDPSTGCRNAHRAGRGERRHVLVGGGIEDLEVPEAGEQRREDTEAHQRQSAEADPTVGAAYHRRLRGTCVERSSANAQPISRRAGRQSIIVERVTTIATRFTSTITNRF